MDSGDMKDAKSLMLKSDLRGIETIILRNENRRSEPLKSDLRGIETFLNILYHFMLC